MAEDNTRRSRRRLLKIIGAGGAGLLAGCTGGGGGGGGSGGGGTGGGGTGGGGSGGTGGGSTPEPEVEFPTRDITLIIPYSPGGGFDTYSRIAAQHLTEMFDVNVNPNNVAGSGGRIAMEQVYNAQPDGHTILLVDGDAVPIEQAREDVRYNLADYTYLPGLLQSKNIISVSRQSGITTWDEYVTAMQNEELIVCSPGRTDPGVVAPYLVGLMGEVYDPQIVLDNLLLVEGTTDCLPAAERGEAHVIAWSASSALSPSRLEAFRPIAEVSLEEENPYPDRAPGLETMATLGLGDKMEAAVGLLSGVWTFVAPPDTPESQANVLREALAEVLQSESYQQALAEVDRPVMYTPWEQSKEIMLRAAQAWEENVDIINELA